MQKSKGIWFWILIISIFVLYCIAWRRPFCQTLDSVQTSGISVIESTVQYQ